MKVLNLMGLSLILMFIVSCSKEMEDTINNEVRKSFNVYDSEGNYVEVEVSSNNALSANITADDFILITTKEQFRSTKPSDTSFDNNQEQTEHDEYVFVNVVDKQFSQDITGFRLQRKETNTPLRGYNLHYYYGATRVRGASVTYTLGLSGCSLKVKLARKNSGDIFYNTVASSTLPTAGSTFSWSGSSGFDTYRLRCSWSFSCSSPGYSYFWIV